MVYTRKAQEEGTAHILIALITILLVAFILFLPSPERAQLLGTSLSGPGITPQAPGQLQDPVLLEKSVGRLEFYPPEGFDHALPSTHIFEARNAVQLHQFPSFIVKRNWFVNKQHSFAFIIEDIVHTKNVILAFDAPVANGPLQVLLNGQLIFEGVLTGPTLNPIRLPGPLLREQNELAFVASSVGGKFWKTNTLNLQNARVIGDLTDLSQTSSSSVFTLSPTEKNNLIGARLVVIPVCDQKSAGVLTLAVNSKPVFTGVPDCGVPLRQSISLAMLTTGTNTISYSTDRGDYRLEGIVVDTDLKDVRSFIEYFEVPPLVFERVLRGSSSVVIEVDFVDDGEPKRAELNINGHLTVINQKEPYYSRVINPWLQPGARNYVEIIPETALNIIQVRVRYT